ncbi:cytidylyltransferase domain-containing protein [Sulfurimonas sp. NW9]|uniref:acylneuraminate cytidylyltransferase family protein n=1 Tax=Sulfurimonas sp. NW9 TaxID=2922728 RepID=UPI003DA9C72A
MFQSKRFLAVIPARGGSKRLEHKNILPLAGKPLIAWSIEAAKKSKYIDDVVVSSDDEEILNIAKECSAQVLKRPKELASDTATTFDTIKHTIDSIQENYDYIILLQPTSPLRDEQDIDSAIEYMFKKKADAVVSVCEVEHSPLWSNTLPKDRNMSGFLKEELLNRRSQDIETYYRLNGAIYIARTKKFLENKGFFLQEKIYAYVMEQSHSIDIDTKLDFDIASSIISKI